ncbi:enterotoxin A family protein [Citrobacter meridianamericanus]|uniref:Uncharacterized protein n=1 Tax=Citrobacter meridianamericanus TaxID=2894201 RepID=A0ABT1B7P9_9ENTR|nr:enterotoxin A family protein [Citrobacter meridianamericanus]MCO5781610.1 hypothetical protein [Citrobacter meridianamericanus]
MKNIILGLMCFFVSLDVLANLPEDVYRRDTRSPEHIFSEGFRPRGSNPNLLDHVSGASLRPNAERLSGWVSTSSSWDWVTTPRYPINEFWVYRIRPGHNSFSVIEAFESFIRYRPNSESDISFVSGLLNVYREQQEWAFLGDIPPEDIEWGARYVFRVTSELGGTYVEEERRINPRYFQATSTPNPDAYPITIRANNSVSTITSYPASREPRLGFTSLSLTSCWGSHSSPRVKRNPPECNILSELKVSKNMMVKGGALINQAIIDSMHAEM